ncbi:MAG: aminotransferase class V-fold PLP-dependent enzyme [Desulfurococcaceae archaeon]
MKLDVLEKVKSVKSLLIPGPIEIPSDIFSYVSLKPISHRDKLFTDLVKDIEGMLRDIMGVSRSDYIVFIPGSSTVGIDAVCANIFRGVKKALVINQGFFGLRLVEISSRYTGSVINVENWPPKYLDKDGVLEVLEREEYEVALLVFNETSTGYVMRFLDEASRVIKSKGAFTVIDGVSGIGAEEFKFSEWRVDALITGPQKALLGLPGLSIVALSKQLTNFLNEVGTRGKVPFYFDLLMYIDEYEKYGWLPTTPPVNSMYVLYAGLKKIVSYGVENYIKSYGEKASKIYEYAGEKGLKPFIKDQYYRSNAVIVLEVNGALKVVEELAKRGILIASGLGGLRDKIIRIGITAFTPLEKVFEAIDLINEIQRT